MNAELEAAKSEFIAAQKSLVDWQRRRGHVREKKVELKGLVAELEKSITDAEQQKAEVLNRFVVGEENERALKAAQSAVTEKRSKLDTANMLLDAYERKDDDASFQLRGDEAERAQEKAQTRYCQALARECVSAFCIDERFQDAMRNAFTAWVAGNGYCEPGVFIEELFGGWLDEDPDVFDARMAEFKQNHIDAVLQDAS